MKIYENDKKFAAAICKELMRGHFDVIIELNECYGSSFKHFINIQLNKFFSEGDSTRGQFPEIVEDILQNFWLKKIMDKKVICDFQGKNNASLKTFLYRVLYFHIIDEIRSIIRLKETILETQPEKIENEDLRNPPPSDYLEQVEEELFIEQAVDMVLEKLSQKKRSKDAEIIRRRMEGQTYEDIAASFGDRPEAIKKQCTRQKTGSYARFMIEFNCLLKNRNIKLEFDRGEIVFQTLVKKENQD